MDAVRRSNVKTTNYEAVVASVPINRATAIAASGTNRLEPETDEQKRETLLILWKRCETQIAAATDSVIRKRFIAQKLRIEAALRELTPRVKGRRTAQNRSLPDYICDVVKERVMASEWRSILAEARHRAAQAEALVCEKAKP